VRDLEPDEQPRPFWVRAGELDEVALGWLRQPFGLEDLKVRDLYVRQLWDSRTWTL
jgi:hypothetical protein